MNFPFIFTTFTDDDGFVPCVIVTIPSFCQSFMTCHRMFKSNTTGATSIAGTAYRSEHLHEQKKDTYIYIIRPTIQKPSINDMKTQNNIHGV